MLSMRASATSQLHPGTHVADAQNAPGCAADAQKITAHIFSCRDVGAVGCSVLERLSHGFR